MALFALMVAYTDFTRGPVALKIIVSSGTPALTIIPSVYTSLDALNVPTTVSVWFGKSVLMPITPPLVPGAGGVMLPTFKTMPPSLSTNRAMS